MTENRIYLDNAATTPLDKDVAESMYEVMKEHFGTQVQPMLTAEKLKASLRSAEGKSPIN